jgi:hypothetical protein
VTGILESRHFIVTGQRMDLLVGGGNYPSTCYVALVDPSDSTIIYSETGLDDDLMTPRHWDLIPYQGRECVIRIVDLETADFGHINVDEIVEILDLDPPAPPTDVVAAYHPEGVDLDWNDAPEEDFLNFRIYRSTDPDFQPGVDNLVQEVPISGWSDPTAEPWEFVYKITTVDQLGNESEPRAPSGISALPLPGPVPGSHLSRAVPNPFNPLTRIDFKIAGTGPVSLKIYDPAGRLVTTLVDEVMSAGIHQAVWNGRDSAGRTVSAGVYLYRLETGNYSRTRRMTLVR